MSRVGREQIVALRRAVIAAHPDHGGTTASLQSALRDLRNATTAPLESGAAVRRTSTRRNYPPPPAPTSTQNVSILGIAIDLFVALARAWIGLVLASMAALTVLRAIQLVTGSE